jgi:hypothetical protein
MIDARKVVRSIMRVSAIVLLTSGVIPALSVGEMKCWNRYLEGRWAQRTCVEGMYYCTTTYYYETERVVTVCGRLTPV